MLAAFEALGGELGAAGSSQIIAGEVGASEPFVAAVLVGAGDAHGDDDADEGI